jgi:hypothetical protein
MENIWLIRHSKRLAHINVKKWMKTERYNENPYDDPLTKDGYTLAKKAALAFIKQEKNLKKYKYIYSSPFTRCIETSLIFSKTIYKETGILLLVRIENGLNVNESQSHSKIEFKDGKLNFDECDIVMDHKMKASNIFKIFGKYKKYFDQKYEPFISFDIAKHSLCDIKKNWEQKLKVLDHFMKHEKNIILCSHGEVFYPILCKFYRKNASSEFKKMVWKNYCSAVKFSKENNKYVVTFKPNVLVKNTK